MTSSWVEEHLRQLQTDSANGANLLARACSATPQMFDNLIYQLNQDVAVYGERRNRTVRAHRSIPNAFVIKTEEFPLFEIHLELGSMNRFTIESMSQESISLNADHAVNHVTVLAGTGQDDFYYAFDGKKIASVQDLSKLILKHLLR
jgi:hypothetical protein